MSQADFSPLHVSFRWCSTRALFDTLTLTFWLNLALSMYRSAGVPLAPCSTPSPSLFGYQIVEDLYTSLAL
ncbi:hypothetical protein LINPERHAP2_LOCUS42207, partial [Linum perenne]